MRRGSLRRLAISLLILFGVMAYYTVPAQLADLFLPAFIVLAVLASLGPWLWSRRSTSNTATSLRNSLHRAVRALRLAGRLLQRGHPRVWRFWYSLNPVVGVIDGFRWCLLGGESHIYVPGSRSACLSLSFLMVRDPLLPPRREGPLRILSEPPGSMHGFRVVIRAEASARNI